MNSREIIKTVLRERHIGAEDFFSRNRDNHLVSARKEAALRMNKAGYSPSFIARAIKRNYTTVMYYLSESFQARKAATYRNRRVLKFLDPVARDVILETARLEETTPEVIIAQWVNERAQYEASAKARAA